MNDVNIFHLANIHLPIEKNRLLMLFVGVNLLFTGIDVVLAHSINSYIPVYEWIPILYFPLGSISCFLAALKTKPQKWQALIHIMLDNRSISWRNRHCFSCKCRVESCRLFNMVVGGVWFAYISSAGILRHLIAGALCYY